MSDRDLAEFSALTFDCYGTLIDWETGIWDALQPLLMQNPAREVNRAGGSHRTSSQSGAGTARRHRAAAVADRPPEAMVRHKGDADPEAVRIIKVRGNSMEPEMRDGDRLGVDTARRVPAAGELFVLWDGNGLVVKRVVPEPGEGTMRLVSANPEHAEYSPRAADVHIVGNVVRKVTQA